MEHVSTYFLVPFISGAFNVLIDRLIPKELAESLIGRDSTEAADFEKLISSMDKVKNMINEAEQVKDLTKWNVKEWLNEVVQAVYDAEDLIDERETTQQLRLININTDETTHVSPNFCQVLSNITRTFEKLAEQGLFCMTKGLSSKSREIDQRLEQAQSESSHPKDQWPSRPSSTSFVDEFKIYGRDSERDHIFNILEEDMPGEHDRGSLKHKKFNNGVHVIAIVGMPGIGKTTFARLLYNNDRADKIFPFKSWFSVTQVFDPVRIICTILEELPQSSEKMPLLNYENVLQKHMQDFRQRVAGKRILLVFDDVYDEKELDEGLKHILEALKNSAAPGCAIIFTAQNEDVARSLHPTHILPLHELRNDDGLTLFKEHAFFGYPNHAPHGNKWESIGKIIVSKCRGLPLAIEVIARYLRSVSAKEWESIASNKMWELPDDVKEKIRPALLLSYKYLPAHLRRCFAYCSIFPKNYRFEKEKLVLLWMAEGFIENEDRGYTCFNNLVERSFFQLVSTSNTSKHYFVMHDLIHDLAVYVMKELATVMLKPNISHVEVGSIRHFSFVRSKYDDVESFGLTASCYGRLRTFLALPMMTSSNQSSYLSHKSLQSLQLFGCLRVMSLSGYKITIIPPSLGGLKHLRYLDFSSTFIKELPESICVLLNLQTLLLSDCKQLIALPTMIGKLVNLRHLDIHGACLLEEMPEDLCRLSNLRTLTDFVIGENSGSRIKELGGLLQLRGSVRISGLENVVDVADALAARLIDKAFLDELVLMQQEECYDDDDRQHESVLHSLKPHTNLRRLTIDFYEGGRFPNWLGDESFCNLDNLLLQNCPKCIQLPPLGQLPSLKHLVIKDFRQLENIGMEFYGRKSSSSSPFKSLVTLKFEGLKQWKEWVNEEDVEPFPRLQELHVLDCKELNGDLPWVLPSLEVLDIKKCPRLSKTLPRTPCLRELSLEDFTRIDTTSFARLTCLTNLSLTSVDQVEIDTFLNAQEAIQQFSCLERLLISLAQIINEGAWHLPSSLESLTLSIPTDEHMYTVVAGCSKLQYLQLHNFSSPAQLPAGDSQNLRFLSLVSCLGLSQFPIILQGSNNFESLYDLYLKDCWELISIPEGSLVAPNLISLTIHGCDILTTLPNNMPASLQFLSIQYCPEFESFPEGGDDGFCQSLQTLCIGTCKKFRSLPESISTHISLELLDIQNCASFVSFPANGLPPNLQNLKMYNCENLTSLPEGIHHYLKFLYIMMCPKLRSFPQVGLPPSLESLLVVGCDQLIRSYADWQLSRLVSLKELSITGVGDILCFPIDGSLSSRLSFLRIEQFSRLESINFRELQRIPTLREFEIERCPKLVTFSGSLPQSLYRLAIKRSPIVEKCTEPGPYAKMVSHITCLELHS